MKLEPPVIPQPRPNPNLMRCTACGKDMARSARICPHCGKTYTTGSGIFFAILLALFLGGAIYIKIAP